MKTTGRWPWKSESGKKRVITYLWNLLVPKIDGAYATTDALLKVGRRIDTAEGMV